MRGWRVGPVLRRVVVYTRRRFGMALGALLVAWSPSDIVLTCAGMSRLASAERLARRHPLQFQAAAVSHGDAVRQAGGADSVRVLAAAAVPTRACHDVRLLKHYDANTPIGTVNSHCPCTGRSVTIHPGPGCTQTPCVAGPCGRKSG